MSAPEFDPDMSAYNRPFWEHANEDELAIQRCTDCEEYTYPPRAACPNCLSNLEWVPAEGKGTVYSYGIVHHPDPPGIIEDEELPVIGAVIELDEGPRMVTNLTNAEIDDVDIGDEVNVVFEQYNEEVTIPQFEPSG